MPRDKQPITGLLIWGLLFLIGFTMLAWSVKSNFAWVDTFDTYWIDKIQSFVSDPLTKFAKLTTKLGYYKLIIVLTIVIAIVLFIKKRFAEGLWFGGTVLFGIVLTHFMKEAFDRDRPEFLPLVDSTSGSFPSGHAVVTSVFYGLLGLVILLVAIEAWKKILTGLVTSLFLMYIVLTRIYLGAHFPTDVIAGICIGLASVFISVAIYMIVEEQLRILLHKIKLNDQSRLFVRQRD